eukprot:GILI01027073.1.p1 GENE.GILI01027073.1~~GILI01027073.1.p1  ORF type:complete len:461 (-),score=108.77 GILI01027073.1:855-2111(-)
MSKPVIAIVDPFSSGKLLAAHFHQKGCSTVSVLHSNDIPAFFMNSYVPADFDHEIIHLGDIEETCARLRALNVESVVVGSEPGVELSDILSERLGLRSNGTCMSECRRNKYLMQEALRKAGLRAVGQCMAKDFEEARTWITEQWKKFPVVCKPLRSAGTDGVTLCHSLEEVEQVFSKICGVVNQLGEVEDAVLVQEYLQGTEFVVDTVSLDGKHHVAHFWRYDKRKVNGAAFVYFGLDLLPSSGAEQEKLKEYIFRVLDVLQISHGPAHSEVMILPDGDLCLVETGARIIGGGCAALATAGIGWGQLELTADIYRGASLFNQVYDTPYTLLRTVHEIFLVSPSAGVPFAPEKLEPVRSLPSFSSMSLALKAGEPTKVTVDLFSSPGCVVLVHEDPEEVEKAKRLVHDIQTSLYTVEAA